MTTRIRRFFAWRGQQKPLSAITADRAASVPSVVLSERNRHIAISPSIHVESIAPGHGIRYTAMVKPDRRLRDGRARFALTVLQCNKSIGKVTEFDIMTKK